jgi:hypothetical protein
VSRSAAGAARTVVPAATLRAVMPDRRSAFLLMLGAVHGMRTPSVATTAGGVRVFTGPISGVEAVLRFASDRKGAHRPTGPGRDPGGPWETVPGVMAPQM